MPRARLMSASPTSFSLVMVTLVLLWSTVVLSGESSEGEALATTAAKDAAAADSTLPTPPSRAAPGSADVLEPSSWKERALASPVLMGPDHPLRGRVIGAVPRVTTWGGYTKALATSNVPIIFQGSTASRWRAVRAWNFEHIKNFTSILQFARSSKNPVFTLAGEAPLNVSMKNNYSTTEAMPMSDFVIDPAERSEFLYYSGPLENWPGAEKEIDTNSFEVSPFSQTCVWMGHKGVTATTHYDKSHNFFVQVHGHKRWVLFPPTEWKTLYPHPLSHPHYHQTQLDFTKVYTEPEVGAKFPLAREALGYEAYLFPGDLMYIPAYWFHQVEAVTDSISTSTVSPSPSEILAFNISELALPPVSGREWSAPKLSLAAAIFLDSLTTAIYAPPPPPRKGGQPAVVKASASDLPLQPQDGDSFTAASFASQALLNNRFIDIKDNMTPVQQYAREVKSTKCYEAIREGKSLKTKVDTAGLSKLAKEWASKAAPLFQRLPVGVKETVLADTYERIATHFVGVNNMAVFFTHCLSA